MKKKKESFRKFLEKLASLSIKSSGKKGGCPFCGGDCNVVGLGIIHRKSKRKGRSESKDEQSFSA